MSIDIDSISTQAPHDKPYLEHSIRLMISAILNTNALTNKGMVRSNNEDSYSLYNEQGASSNNSHGPGSLLIVADGMGGAEAGEIASRIAVETIQRAFASLPMHDYHDVEATELMRQFILDAHRNIVEDARRNPKRQGMGTTIVVAWIFSGKAYIGWSGDSRCYLYHRDGHFELVTRDHSHVWEQYLSGGYDAELAERARLDDHSNIITQCLGDEERDPRPEVELRRLQEGDRFILCSDGLNSMISDEAIRQIVINPSSNSTKLICDSLIRAANSAGGQDNVTVIVTEVIKLIDIPYVSQRQNAPPPESLRTLENPVIDKKTQTVFTRKNKILWGMAFLAVLMVSWLTFEWMTPIKPASNVLPVKPPMSDSQSLAEKKPSPRSSSITPGTSDELKNVPGQSNLEDRVNKSAPIKSQSAPKKTNPVNADSLKRAANDAAIESALNWNNTVDKYLESNASLKKRIEQDCGTNKDCEKMKDVRKKTTGKSEQEIINALKAAFPAFTEESNH